MGRVPEGRQGSVERFILRLTFTKKAWGAQRMGTGLLDSEAVMLPPRASEVALAIQSEKGLSLTPVTVRGACGLAANLAVILGANLCPHPMPWPQRELSRELHRISGSCEQLWGERA